MIQGLFTLANDIVYDQLVALLNSIEANYSRDIPVCVIPYDDNIEKVKGEISKRENTVLFSDKDSIKRWEGFAEKVWKNYSLEGNNIFGRHSITNHRKFCVFDGPFDRFVFMDADTLLIDDLNRVFDKLDEYDFVAYDYQYKDPSHVYNVKSSKLIDIFGDKRVKSEVFCTGFFASKRNLLSEEKCSIALSKLKSGQTDILYPKACEQSLLNYIIMVNNIYICNLAIKINKDKRTGNSVTSTHFENKNHVLYDKGNRLTYLHYIGIPSNIINRVCKGENIDFPYRDIFLHYRYLYDPERRPVFHGLPRFYRKQLSLYEKLKKCLGARL